MTFFDSVLVANRGEIAVRILATARSSGYRTVAVYSDADGDAPHVAAADQAVRIGPGPVAESYLDPSRILEAAALTGAQAIHPGYGFLSENAAFCPGCRGGGPDLDRAAARRDRADGQQGGGEAAYAGSRRALPPRVQRRCRDR